MKVTLHLIAKHEEEYAQLHLHKENKRMEELKEYLENDGTSNPVLAVTQEGKAVYLSGNVRKTDQRHFQESDFLNKLVHKHGCVYHSAVELIAVDVF